MQTIIGGPYFGPLTLTGDATFSGCEAAFSNIDDIANDISFNPDNLAAAIYAATGVTVSFGQGTGNSIAITLQFYVGAHKENLIAQIEQLISDWVNDDAVIQPDASPLSFFVTTGELVLGLRIVSSAVTPSAVIISLFSLLLWYLN